MNRFAKALVICLSTATISGSLAAAEPGGKLFKTTNGDRSLVFIPVSTAFTPTGEFSADMPQDWRAQHEQVARMFDKSSARIAAEGIASEPCGGFSLAESDVEMVGDRSTPSASVRNAKAIFEGRVEEVTPGFFYGSPGSLLRLGDLRVLKADSGYVNVVDSLFIRHPYAHFTVGRTEVCRQTRSTHVPQVGDRALVFAFNLPSDESGTLVLTFTNDFLIGPADGPIEFPRWLAGFREYGDTTKAIALRIATELGVARQRRRQR